jgi:hypothetical protein
MDLFNRNGAPGKRHHRNPAVVSPPKKAPRSAGALR